MYRVRWPWASRSISRTRCPISASAAPRLTAVVVLPTPPFCIATAIVRAKSAPSLTEAGRDRPDGAALEGRTTIIGRGVRDPADRCSGRGELCRGRWPAIPREAQALSGDMGAGVGDVRGRGCFRNHRSAGRLVRGYL